MELDRAGDQQSGKRLLRHLGLPTTPCDIEKARGPPEAFDVPDVWDDSDPGASEDIDIPFPEVGWEDAA